MIITNQKTLINDNNQSEDANILVLASKKTALSWYQPIRRKWHLCINQSEYSISIVSTNQNTVLA